MTNYEKARDAFRASLHEPTPEEREKCLRAWDETLWAAQARLQDAFVDLQNSIDGLGFGFEKLANGLNEMAFSSGGFAKAMRGRLVGESPEEYLLPRKTPPHTLCPRCGAPVLPESACGVCSPGRSVGEGPA